MAIDDPTTALRLRAATADDVPTVLRLIRGLAEYERLLDECVATEAQLRETLFGAQPQAEVVIAEWNGEAAGFALFFHNYSTFLARRGLYLEDLFVFPEHRGRGIGRALLSHLARVALARGCGRFEWAVLDWNAPAIGFYRALGAVAMDEWTVMRVTGDALERLAAENGKAENETAEDGRA
ncbi:GNAT family N-acetyltransferase [Roseisolibacter agri]|uniref:N-acetyltransferase n=1 Tax=Roseisolibacter agri TaxID=2014610 RepID=A0AA37QD22_9BACT|nr:GNAT family N-acetyltransferase [Roseisolibacter agri]GLC23498.1 N-acetyltransferase [Roseisolibacter agri]